MSKFKRRLAWLGLSVVMAALAMIYLLVRAEISVSDYANHEEARKAKAVGESKWLPVWLPLSAVSIREAHSSDTNQVWLEFRIDSTGALTARGCEPVARSQYKEKLPEVTKSLAIRMNRDPTVLLGDKAVEIYACKDQLGLNWGLLFQPASKTAWSWNVAR